ncbi:MAG: type II toxin-antitoxin system HicA family toxin [Acidobacteria bacterium]|nr:type II toxin-antitoxin system HicA family toxin [Acidobacteriota bacterium]
MSKLPALTGKKLVSALEQAGFSVLRVRGSHHFMAHPDGRKTVVPVHSGEVLGPGLLSKILRDIEWTADTFRARL